jgi:hypothetical protein
VGFRNVPELKGHSCFGFAEFRTAAEVGLKLPISESKTIKVPMSEAARGRAHLTLLQQYRALISDPRAGATKQGAREA